MADWNHPVVGDPYATILDTYIIGRDVDAITLQKSAPSNLPIGAMKYDRTNDLFAEWDGAAFNTKVLSIAGGGTGGATAGTARTALGLGSMATQDSTAVNITGGSISGATVDAAAITSGVLALARGGTGVSLTIGASGEFLRSTGAVLAFGHDGANLTNLNASQLTSGTVPLARLSAGIGKYVQIQQRVNTTFQTVSPIGSYVAITDGFVTITPSSITNRALIRFNIQFILSVGAVGHQSQAYARIKRNGIVIATWGNIAYAIGPSGSDQKYCQISLEYLDSPGTTSAITYQLEMKAINNPGTSAALSVNSGTLVAGELSRSTYTVEEIGPP